MKCSQSGCTRPRAFKVDGTMYSICEPCRESHRKSDEKRKDKKREYDQTPRGKKSYRIRRWKYRGLIHPNYDELYERYINTTNCERCDIELTEDKRHTSTTRCMDHDHITGLFRNIVCNRCNSSRELRQPPARSSNTLAE